MSIPKFIDNQFPSKEECLKSEAIGAALVGQPLVEPAAKSPIMFYAGYFGTLFGIPTLLNLISG